MSYIDLESFTSGFKLGEMAIISSGRQTGKSYYYKALKNRAYGSIYNTDINSLYANMFTIQSQSKYKFSRAKWYVAEYDWVHYGEVMAWCKEQFGPHSARPDAWSRWWDRYEGKIFLRDEKDYVLFTLRWS